MAARPPIPDPIKREVRQRCGFGCVICGLPLYEYDHTTPWAEVHEHEAANLILLCPNHHAEVTRGTLSREDVGRAAENPYNIQRGQVEHIFHVSHPPMEVVLGTNTIRAQTIIEVDGVPLISLENLLADGSEVGISARIFDREQGEILSIVRNEWTAPTGIWDIEHSGTSLVLRSAPRNVLLELRSEPPRRLVFARGRMFFEGWELNFTADTLLYQGRNQLTMRNSVIEVVGGYAGISLRSH